MSQPVRKRFIAMAVSSEGRLIPGFRTYRFQAESLEVAAQYVLRRVRPPPGFHNFRMRVEEVIPRRWREYLMFLAVDTRAIAHRHPSEPSSRRTAIQINLKRLLKRAEEHR